MQNGRFGKSILPKSKLEKKIKLTCIFLLVITTIIEEHHKGLEIMLLVY